MAELNAQLAELEEMNYAAAQSAILIVLQGLDTAGKDGTIRHVMRELNPAGVMVKPFKQPNPYEVAHDFIWRAHRSTPIKGSIAIFNRSYYEDVLVVRVHKLAPKSVWEGRFEHINNFERLLTDSGTIILKFYLHISKQEQKERLIAREKNRQKAWKLSTTDWTEHELYEKYTEAYEDALTRCSTESAPWYVIPGDHKWFRNVAVAQAIVSELQSWKEKWEKTLEERGREQLAAIATEFAAHPQ